MAFMQPQMTRRIEWFEFETWQEGMEWIPVEDTSKEEIESGIKDNGDEMIESVEIVEGWGVRRSAPGYLDCTHWIVFREEDDAQEAFDEMTLDDEEDEREEA